MYYVKVMTRSSGATRQGTPTQAVDYITDGHDARRDPNYSDAELSYIARTGEGWKTDLEGGRVPLAGFGALASQSDEGSLRQRFEEACLPSHDRRATTGYKSFTVTLPKELSLYAEGHREKASAAINAAVGSMLADAYRGYEYSAVAAIHTRNEAGEIHYHAHVLLGKFAKNIETGRTVSLNSKAGGNTGARVSDLKRAWKRHVDYEIKAALGVSLTQSAAYARPTLELPDGSTLPPLTRETRRMLEKKLAPMHTTIDEKTGKPVQRRFRINDKWDAAIFEVAARSGRWTREAFDAVFPEKAALSDRIAKRVLKLQSVGYLDPDGKILPPFRTHFCARHGIETPELQRIRLEVANATRRESRKSGRPVAVPSLWEAAARYKWVAARIEKLGFTKDDLKTLKDEATLKKPTPEYLAELRRTFAEQTRLALGATHRRQAPVAIRNLKRGLSLNDLAESASVGKGFLASFRSHQAMADKVFAALGLGAKSPAARLAAPGVAAPWTHRDQQIADLFGTPGHVPPFNKTVAAITRARFRAERTRLFSAWSKEYLKQPIAKLKQEAKAFERPTQQPELPKVEKAATVVAKANDSEALERLLAGWRAVYEHSPHRLHPLTPWIPNPEGLVQAVKASHTQGQEDALPAAVLETATFVGRTGDTLHRGKQAAAALAGFAPTGNPATDEAAVRLMSRLAGHGVAGGLRNRETLGRVSPETIKSAVESARAVGLLDAGTAWAFKPKEARTTAAAIVATISKEPALAPQPTRTSSKVSDPSPTPPTARELTRQLIEGWRAVYEHAPQRLYPLAEWQSRPEVLAKAAAGHQSDPKASTLPAPTLEAARLVARVGAALNHQLKAMEVFAGVSLGDRPLANSEAALLMSRLVALGLAGPLRSADAVNRLSAPALLSAVREARTLGLLSSGTGWAFKDAEARTLAADLIANKTQQRKQEQELVR